MSQSLVSIQNFLKIKNTNNTNTIFGDIAFQMQLENLKNNEVMENVLHRKEIVDADTFIYEYNIYPQVSKLDVSAIQGQEMKRGKVTAVFNDLDWLVVGYKFDIRTKRSKRDWGETISTEEANMYVAKNDIDNLIALEMVKNYALSTGRYKIIPNLDNTASKSTREEITDAIANLAEVVETMKRTKTEVNMGIEESRLNYIFSGYVALNFVKAAQYMNASDSAFEVFKAGSLARIYGKGYTTSIYLDSISTKGTSTNNYKTFNFSGILGMIYAIDNIDVYTKAPTDIGIDSWLLVPGDKTMLSREITWKTMSLIKPSREHLQFIFLREEPTLQEVNDARTWLSQEQPSLYKEFASPITQSTLDIMNINAKNFRVVCGPDIPQDGVPNTTNRNVIEKQEETKKSVANKLKEAITK